jgi:hypothetical protein
MQDTGTCFMHDQAVPTSSKVAEGTGPLRDKKVPVMQELRYETCKLFKVIYVWSGRYLVIVLPGQVCIDHQLVDDSYLGQCHI